MKACETCCRTKGNQDFGDKTNHKRFKYLLSCGLCKMKRESLLTGNYDWVTNDSDYGY